MNENHDCPAPSRGYEGRGDVRFFQIFNFKIGRIKFGNRIVE